MAASDVLAQFMPDLARAKGYLPDPQIQAQLIQNITDAQQARIKQMGDLQAQSAGAPYAGLQQMLSSGKEGFKMASEEQTKAAQRRETNALAQNQEMENEHKQRQYQAEEDFLDSEDPQGAVDPEDNTAHVSHRTSAMQAGFDVKKMEPGEKKQKMTTDLAESNARVEAANVEARNARWSGKDEHTKTLLAQFDNEAQGIARTTQGQPDVRAKKMAELSKSYAAKGLSPSDLANEGALSTSQADNSVGLAKAAADTNFKIGPEGTNMSRIVEHGVASVKAYTQLKNAAQQYKANLRLGDDGLPIAGINETALAQQARENFAKVLEDMGQKTLADNIRGLDYVSVGSRMDGLLNTLGPQIKKEWAQSKTTLEPETTKHPEVTNVDGLMDRELGPSSSAAISSSLPPIDSIDPVTGNPTQAQNIQQTLARKRAAVSGGANAAPAGPVAVPGTIAPQQGQAQPPPGQQQPPAQPPQRRVVIPSSSKYLGP